MVAIVMLFTLLVKPFPAGTKTPSGFIQFLIDVALRTSS